MNEDKERISINNYNCRGIRNAQKRQNILKWINTTYSGITLLKVTHSTLSDKGKWEKEWGEGRYVLRTQ